MIIQLEKKIARENATQKIWTAIYNILQAH